MSSSFAHLLQNQPQFQTHQALIVVGLQNDFCSPNGKLPVTQPAGLLDRIKRLVPTFREHAGHVIWVRTELDPNQPVEEADDADQIITSVPGESPSSEDEEGSSAELTLDDLPPTSGSRRRPTDLLKRIQARSRKAAKDAEAAHEDELFLTQGSARQICVAGSSGAAWADDIAAEIKPEDTLVTKTRYSALKGTSLLLTLRAKLITELYVCGCISNISVYATAVEAARHGIQIYLVDDCVGYRQLNRHREAFRQMVDYMGASKISCASLMAQLTGEAEKGDNSPGRKADTDHDLGTMLKNLKLKDEDGVPCRDSSSPPKHTEAERPSPKENAVAVSANALEAADSDDALLDETTLLLERHSIRSRPPIDQRIPPRSSGSVKSKIRMRRKPSQKSKSPPDASGSAQKENARGSPESPKPGQVPVAPVSKLTSREDSPSESLKASTPKPGTSQPAEGKTTSSTTATDGTQCLKKTSTPQHSKKAQSLANLPTLGPSHRIGEGDSRILYDFLPQSLRASADPKKTLEEVIFHKLYNEVRWQKMMHAQGEVPRLVSVQGEVAPDGSMPVYRHPSDQSLPLLHFSPAVLRVRKQVEELIKHPVNHVLIQLYRGGNDYISEHSDKTLDIVRGSSIVNVSFGAQRTMRLRTKRSARQPDQAEEEASAIRQTQRVSMPHNSVFVLDPQTNMRWLHGINADKRPSEEKSDQEKSFAGMRISLTFRHIGTFLTNDSTKIWGQGATSRTKEAARPVINGDEKETEELIRAFGKENQSTEFDWEKTYGKGSDVLHFRKTPPETPTLYTSHSDIERLAVTLYLDELGLDYVIVEPPPVRHPDDYQRRAICFRDTDALHTEVEGAVLILFYLESHYSHLRTAPKADASPKATTPPAGSRKEETENRPPSSTAPTTTENRAAATATQTYLSHASHAYRTWSSYLSVVTSTSSSCASSSSSTPPSPLSDLTHALNSTLAALEDLRATDRLRRASSQRRPPSPFLVGEAFSIADCAVWPLIDAVRASGWEGCWSEGRWPELEAYWSAVVGAGRGVVGRRKGAEDKSTAAEVGLREGEGKKEKEKEKEKDKRRSGEAGLSAGNVAERASASSISSSPPPPPSSSSPSSGTPRTVAEKEKGEAKGKGK